jgi:hypothetical protein
MGSYSFQTAAALYMAPVAPRRERANPRRSRANVYISGRMPQLFVARGAARRHWLPFRPQGEKPKARMMRIAALLADALSAIAVWSAA